MPIVNKIRMFNRRRKYNYFLETLKPIEHHTRIPLLHWFPKSVFDSILIITPIIRAAGDYMNLLCLRQKMLKKFQIVVIVLFLTGYKAFGQNLESEVSKIYPYMQALQDFSNKIPQEKVYLHFDNTSYYQGDHIWFKCYIVSWQHQLSDLSKTLYVELLNPGGEILDKQILKIENGTCHGDFLLTRLPFYSGFYEVRAYTKYMLNFGDDVIFSRLLPVFDKPKVEGNYEEKKMLSYGRWGTGHYPMKRERPLKEKNVNLRFFPEGGHLIQGVTSRVAFEATDEIGNPIEVRGTVMNASKQELCSITTLHEGKGVFTYTPADNKRNDMAEVEYAGKKYRFIMPAGLQQGVTMEVDNLTDPDSLVIIVRKNSHTPSEMLGLSVLSGGILQNYCGVWIEENEISFKMDQSKLPSGVSQIVLFNSKGDILCDRLIFNSNHLALLAINVKTNKPAYMPFEQVEMDISLTDGNENPVSATFSLSVKDGLSEVEHKHTVLTDLLLMSEIKGYVRNPDYYFEKEDDTHRMALDVLLMVQGWRRYSWKQMADAETGRAPSLLLKYLPEQGIETNGQIINNTFLGKQVPKPDVQVGMLLSNKADNNWFDESVVETFVTDSQGRFSFVADVSGRWNMILSVSEKGKPKSYQILLDRIFSPEPKRYRYADLQVSIAEDKNALLNDEEMPEPDNMIEDYEAFLIAYQDSLDKLGITEKIHQLQEVIVTAKRRTKEQDIYQNRSTSVAYYDVASEYDDLYDRGKFIGNNIDELLASMNENFSYRYLNGNRLLFYKNRQALVVIDYRPVLWSFEGTTVYKSVNMNAIKSIYINDISFQIAPYIYLEPGDLRNPIDIADKFVGCAVFLEMYPEEEIPVEGAKGVRKTWLEGYSTASEFYSPNYSELPPEPDYRRTLYWNPMVTPDETGMAKIRFYNNSRAMNFTISAETITSQGMIGVYKK